MRVAAGRVVARLQWPCRLLEVEAPQGRAGRASPCDDLPAVEVVALAPHRVARRVERDGGVAAPVRAARDVIDKHQGVPPERVLEEEEHPLLLERSEEHTSELQSRHYLVCRLL